MPSASSTATASGTSSCGGANKPSTGLRVVPPETGICHQVNLEYLAHVVFDAEDGTVYPDTLVGTDSHTPMVNGLGVVGWGVGGIEAEAAMLGQPVTMLVPRVVGFKLHGELAEGVTATDLVLTIAEQLRRHGVVGKFVEFYGPGVAAVPLENRATIGNMSPEYGSTITIFPIDDETLRYLRFTGRSEERVALVEAYAKAQGLWHDPHAEPAYSEHLELDLATIEPSIAGPTRPHDRVALRNAGRAYRAALPALLPSSRGASAAPKFTGFIDRASADSFPASDPPELDPRTRFVKPVPAGRSETTTGTRISEPGDGDARRRHDMRDRPRPRRDRGHHELHQHLEPGGDDRGGVAGPEGRRARASTVKPWVKTSLAPGSRVVMDYYERAGLLPYLEALGFHLVGFGCTTCIGNSGPVDPAISAAAEGLALAVGAVGQPQLRGPHQPRRADELPRLPAPRRGLRAGGHHGHRPHQRSARHRSDGAPVLLADIWPSPAEVQQTIRDTLRSEMFTDAYGSVYDGDDRWNSLDVSTGAPLSSGTTPPRTSTGPRSSTACDRFRRRRSPTSSAPAASPSSGDSITTDHISPAGSIAADSPAGRVARRPRGRATGLQLLRLAARATTRS